MRKNLFILATCLCAAMQAHASTAIFDEPTGNTAYENICCNAGSITGQYGTLYSRLPIYNISHFRKANAASSAVAITVDLSSAAKVTEPTKLLTVSSTHEIGLMATPAGITGNWHGEPWGETIPYAKLANHPSAFCRDASSYISFTVVVSGCCGSGWNGVGGVMAYDVNGDLLINLPLLASAENTDFSAITANLDMVKCISVSPDVSRNTADIASKAAYQASRTERKYLRTRGEWLSPAQWVSVGIGVLLLLGGISITCFRKGKW